MKLSLSKPWRHIGGEELQLHSLFTLAQDASECQIHAFWVERKY